MLFRFSTMVWLIQIYRSITEEKIIVLVNSDKYKNDCSGPADISNPFSPKMIAEVDTTMPLQYSTKRFTIDSPHNIVHQNQCIIIHI